MGHGTQRAYAGKLVYRGFKRCVGQLGARAMKVPLGLLADTDFQYDFVSNSATPGDNTSP